MTLNDDGLHLDFPTAAGDVVLLPLYGVEKPPQAGRDPAADPTSPPRKTRIKTWEWPQVLTRDPLTRIRYWGAATREIPLACEESVERTNGTVTLRSHFTWHALEDDWKTRAIKLAALAPPLARAAKAGSIRLQFSRPWFDLDFLLPDGPGLAVEGVDAFTVTLPALPEGYGMSGPRPRTRLIIDLETQAPDATGGQPHPTWPQLTWPDVRTPTGARWTFGQVKPLRQGAPVKTEVTPLGGNSLVTTFALL